MERRRVARYGAAAVVALVLLGGSAVLLGEPVTVAHREGTLRGFLALHASDGAMLANGDLIQTVRGAQVTSRLVFRFKDGSVQDETVVFSQQAHFRLIRHHLVQKGPAFPRSVDMSIDGASGRVKVHYSDEDGSEKDVEERLDLPPDLANGLIPILLKNVSPSASPETVSLVVATPKPRLVRLAIGVSGRDRFRTGTEDRRAVHFTLKVEIGGIQGWFAKLAGKQPPDSHVWILEGQAPAFVRSEQPFFIGGPLWRIDLVSPTW